MRSRRRIPFLDSFFFLSSTSSSFSSSSSEPRRVLPAELAEDHGHAAGGHRAQLCDHGGDEFGRADVDLFFFYFLCNIGKI